MGTITLIGISTTSLTACNKQQQYTEKELADLKEKNNIKIKDGILEWIAPQEKPFKKVDNKYYFVIWRGDKNYDWRIISFKNDTNVSFLKKTIDNLKDEYYLMLGNYLGVRAINLYIYKPGITGFALLWNKNINYFKSVYRWNIDKNIINLYVDSKTGKIKKIVINK